MTLTAQQQFILGAMCIDEPFRLQLFAAGGMPPAARRAQIATLIRDYAAGSDVQIDDSVTDNVMNVVKSESPCRLASQNACQSVKSAFCPCWPC